MLSVHTASKANSLLRESSRSLSGSLSVTKLRLRSSLAWLIRRDTTCCGVRCAPPPAVAEGESSACPAPACLDSMLPGGEGLRMGVEHSFERSDDVSSWSSLREVRIGDAMVGRGWVWGWVRWRMKYKSQSPAARKDVVCLPCLRCSQDSLALFRSRDSTRPTERTTTALSDNTTGENTPARPIPAPRKAQGRADSPEMGGWRRRCRRKTANGACGNT